MPKVPASNVETDTKWLLAMVILGHAWWWPVGFEEEKKRRDLGLDFGLVDQHDWQAVPHGVNAMALRAFQALGILPVFEVRLADGTNEHFEEIFREHVATIIKQGTVARV